MSTYPSAPSGRVHSGPDGQRLIIERSLPAPIGDVWASLTEPDRVAPWYGSIEGELQPGSTIMVTMSAEDGAPAEPMQILECEPPTRFLVETAGMGEPWRLELELAESDGITTMTFTHQLPDGLSAVDLGPGWEFYADRHHAAFHGNAMPDWDADRYQELLGTHYA